VRSSAGRTPDPSRPLADPDDPRLVLYHATDRRHLASIRAAGLGPSAYLGIRAVADYYAEAIADEGGAPVVLSVRLRALDAAACEVDGPGIEEPITTVVGRTQDDIDEIWTSLAGSWRDSLHVIGSIRYAGTIPAIELRCDGVPLLPPPRRPR
jgi:hypothetical protein